MMLDQVTAALRALKGRGQWKGIAAATGLHYDTVARIARGDFRDPSVRTVEKLAVALALIEPAATHGVGSETGKHASQDGCA